MKAKFVIALIAVVCVLSIRSFADPRQVETSAPLGENSLKIKVVTEQGQAKDVEGRIAKFGMAGNALYNNLMQQVEELNASASKGSHSLSPELYLVLSEARDLAEATDGWFDIVRSKKGAFQFTAKDWRKIDIDHDSKSIRFKSKGITLDIKDISKAFVVEKISNTLTNEGFVNNSVCIDEFICKNNGRDIYTKWLYELKLMDTEYAARAHRYWVSNIAFAEVAPLGLGKDLIDAKSGGHVPGHLISATSFAQKATTATATAIAAYTIGPKGALPFIRRHQEIKAIIVTPKEEILTSLGMEFAKPDYEKDIGDIEKSQDQGPANLKLKEKEGD